MMIVEIGHLGRHSREFVKTGYIFNAEISDVRKSQEDEI